MASPSVLYTSLAVAMCACGGCRPQPAWADATWLPATPPQRIVAASVFAAEVALAIVLRERIAAVHVLAADPRYSLVAESVRVCRSSVRIRSTCWRPARIWWSATRSRGPRRWRCSAPPACRS